jgi:hypothetical protein
MMSVKSRHLLLLLYKISNLIYAFLPALQNLKNASAVRSPFQLLATSFARLPGLSRQSRSSNVSDDLSRAGTSGSLRGPNPYCRVDGRAVPSRSCSSVPVSKRGTQREQTFRCPKISIISRTAWWPIPSCAAISLTVIPI